MSIDYWFGVATTPTIAFLFWLWVESSHWMRWWNEDPERRLGRGLHHQFDRYMPKDAEWWPRSQHTHWWPPSTPWWFIRLAEPIRIRLCLRDPNVRPATPKPR